MSGFTGGFVLSDGAAGQFSTGRQFSSKVLQLVLRVVSGFLVWC